MGNYYKQLITALYVAVYGRAPDYSGLRYWSDEMEGGQPYQHIANGFMQHPLYNHFYGNLDYQGLVNAFYENILGGPGDSAGVNYWVGRLNNGEKAADVLAEFLKISIDIDLSQQGDLSYEDWQAAIQRQDTLTNKIDTGIFYAEYLGEASDMGEGFAGLDVQHDPNYIAARDILQNITADRASVENTKNYIEDNYTPALNLGEWENWFNAFVQQLLDGDWDGDFADLDGLGDMDFDRLFNDLNIDENADDFSWLFDGAGLFDWNWFSAYIDIIINWLAAYEEMWANDFAGLFAGWDEGYGGAGLFGDLEELGLLGLQDYQSLFDEGWDMA